jgi:hypothetical protein
LTRYTYLGLRRLLSHFDEIDSGVVCGPAVALAWSYQYFLLSFVRSKAARSVVRVIARLTAFWLKYFDQYLANKPAALDAASAYYFLGAKRRAPLADRDLVALYRGATGNVAGGASL